MEDDFDFDLDVDDGGGGADGPCCFCCWSWVMVGDRVSSMLSEDSIVRILLKALGSSVVVLFTLLTLASSLASLLIVAYREFDILTPSSAMVMLVLAGCQMSDV